MSLLEERVDPEATISQSRFRKILSTGVSRSGPPRENADRKTKFKRGLKSVLVLSLAVLVSIPLYYIVVSSFKTTVDMALHPLALPDPWMPENYPIALERANMWTGFRNSLILTGFGVLIQVFIGSLASYGMIIQNWVFTTAVGVILTIAFAIPGQATLVPQYMMFARAGLTDSLLGVILLYSAGAIFCYFLMVGYMRGLPRELIEAARIDGAGPFRIYWRIILPLCKPILITVIVFQTMTIWNDFLTPNIYLPSAQNRTVILQVYTAVGQFSTDWPSFMAITVVALTPVLVFFIFCQRWIVAGLMAGSVKG